LPLDFRGQSTRGRGPAVRLRARFAGREHQWQGNIVRIEGEIDPRTRMVHLIAQVQDPYGRTKDSDRTPLAVGLFVEAEIAGHVIENAIVVPRAAMRGTDQVLVVDEQNRLQFRHVEVLRADAEDVVIQSGLSAGEKICLSPLDAAVDGMKVRITEEKPE